MDKNKNNAANDPKFIPGPGQTSKQSDLPAEIKLIPGNKAVSKLSGRKRIKKGSLVTTNPVKLEAKDVDLVGTKDIDVLPHVYEEMIEVVQKYSTDIQAPSSGKLMLRRQIFNSEKFKAFREAFTSAISSEEVAPSEKFSEQLQPIMKQLIPKGIDLFGSRSALLSWCYESLPGLDGRNAIQSVFMGHYEEVYGEMIAQADGVYL